ncbi:MAG: rRNA cytosine-C5-methyltransferase [Muribaculaceae bacterium]|nr:rRNA cytosine-C5-methyltransferase [Muribaculaceae bacterium]
MSETSLDLLNANGFAESLKAYPIFEGLVETLVSTKPSVSVRRNPGKSTSAPFAGSAVPWCPEGITLEERPNFTLDPRLHQGAYYVQDASSMFHAYVVEQLVTAAKRPLTVLDACAAPGGKTTAAISRLPKGSMMVANEFVPQRAAVLRENLIKWGEPNIVITNSDTQAFRKMADSFDIILADVPCSGEGMMRKEPMAMKQWSPKLVSDCADLQWQIVESLWPALRPGGYLIYSTCTFNVHENEEMLARIAKAFPDSRFVEIKTPKEWGIAPSFDASIPACRFIPGRIEGEGLFVGVVQKKGELSQPPISSGKAGGKQHPLAQALIDADTYTTQQSTDGRVNAFPTSHLPLFKQLSSVKGLNIIHHGIVLGNAKGRDLIPSQSLAMTTALRRGYFAECEVGADDALSYLRHQALSLPNGTPSGIVLLTHNNLPLGFVKNLGNRANNLYPKPWMIHI